MFVQFLPFLYKSLVILAKALFCSSHPHLSSVITLIIYYMFELCVVYLFKSSLLGSTLLTCCLCLLRPALRPGSTGQWVSGVVLSRQHLGKAQGKRIKTISKQAQTCSKRQIHKGTAHAHT